MGVASAQRLKHFWKRWSLCTVWTYAGYVVAAEFIVQTETNKQIEEALNIFKSWNPSWSPRYFMSDYSEAEILAIESGSHVYVIFIANKAGNNGSKTITKDEGESLLDLLRTCANAPPPPAHESKQQDHYYQQACISKSEGK